MITLLALAALCPVCSSVRLRRDNQTGVCGYCQARGALPRLARPELEVDGPLVELPSSPPGARVVRPKQIARDLEADRARPGMRVALLRARLARPRRRAHCQGGLRPCPFVGCRHHLAFDVTSAGGIQVNAPGAELEAMPETCSLDVADQGGMTLEKVADLLGITRERIRQIELEALPKLRRLLTSAPRAARAGSPRPGLRSNWPEP